jgi:cell wall-associated NlpC family hydrolase
LLHDRVVVAMLVGAVAPLPGAVERVSGQAGDGAAPAPAQAAPPWRRATDPRFWIGEAAAFPKRMPQLPFGLRVAHYATRFLGVRYLYGGSSPSSGFDCSGFVRYVYAHFGVSLAHSSYAQFGSGRSVNRRALKPGDLVFFDDLGHVGIYIGNGYVLHAPHTGVTVQINPFSMGWFQSTYVGATRPGPP